MLAGFQIGAFTGWVIGYVTVYSNLESAAKEAGSAGVSIIALQAVPTAPDTIFCMATGAAIGLIAGWVANISKTKTSKDERQSWKTKTPEDEKRSRKTKTSEDERQSWWLGK